MDIVYKVEHSTIYALKDGEKIGQIVVPDIDFHWGNGVYVPLAGIAGVGTEEEFRGKGIASRMMEEAKRFALEKGYCCSGVSTNLGNIARRLYAKAGYTTLFRPGRFEKRLDEREVPEVEGVQIRSYREGDEKRLMQLFEHLYTSFFGWRRKTSVLILCPSDHEDLNAVHVEVSDLVVRRGRVGDPQGGGGGLQGRLRGDGEVRVSCGARGMVAGSPASDGAVRREKGGGMISGTWRWKEIPYATQGDR